MPLALPSSMTRQPLVELRFCELTPPSLADNTADWDRLTHSLHHQGFSP